MGGTFSVETMCALPPESKLSGILQGNKDKAYIAKLKARIAILEAENDMLRDIAQRPANVEENTQGMRPPTHHCDPLLTTA